MTSSTRLERVPLSAAQRLRLLFGCFPLVFWTVAFVALYAAAGEFLRERQAVVIPLMGLFVVLFAIQAVKCLRDLALGVLLVQSDLLERTFGQRQTTYAEFKTLGKVRLVGQTRVDAIRGHRYRVYYSPASKVVWKLEAERY